MQLKINVNGNLTADELISHIQALEIPAVITGADLKILAKNRASFRYTTGLTVGRRIKKLLPIDDYDKIAKMTAGEVLSSEFIRADRHIGVTVVCGQDCRMMVFQPLSVELYSSINHIYGKMSGYDHSITQNISQNGASLAAQSARTREIARIVSDLISLHKEAHKLPCFNINAAVRGLSDEITRASRATAKAFKFLSPQKETIIAGSEHDFLLILTFLSTLCTDIGKTVLVELSEAGNEVLCRISAVGGERIASVSQLTTSQQFLSGLDDEIGDIRFWSHLIKLLADSNLWDFSVGQNESGNLCFTLRAPIGEPFDDILLRDSTNAFVLKLLTFFTFNKTA